MISVDGKYSNAIVYIDNCDSATIEQIKALCSLKVYEGCDIQIMPDVHKGKFCPIGTVIQLEDKVIPYTIGNDIGCGVTCYKFKSKKFELSKLDKIIKSSIPYGMDRHNEPIYDNICEDILTDLHCKDKIDLNLARKCICSLGGGNHFIEISKDRKDFYYITVHTGSRYLGTLVSDYYQKKAYDIIKVLNPDIPYEFAWLEGDTFNEYLEDVLKVSEFASRNRSTIINTIFNEMKIKNKDVEFVTDCTHNYIDINRVLRKGAIDTFDKNVIIPINMRDGALLCRMDNDYDSTQSGPHGSGRSLPKNEVANNYTLNSYKKDMEGIFCSIVSKETLEESPYAYRSKDVLLENLSNNGFKISNATLLKPIYNFKSDKRLK